MADYDLSNPVDAELVSHGMEECRCNPMVTHPLPPCVVCGEREAVLAEGHTHYKGQVFDSRCLVLALLRQLKQKA